VGGRGGKIRSGTVIEGPVTNLTKFGAFVQLTEGVEGMIHVSEISAEKRINHPQEVLRQDKWSRRRCWRSMSRSGTSG